MEKALLDYLMEEKGLVREINRLDDKIEHAREWRILLITETPDCEAKKRDIKVLQNKIDELNNQKADCKEKLLAVRRNIAGYINYLIN